MSRPIFGYVYELALSSPAEDEAHPYVGKTTTTIHKRVHGSSGHTSLPSILKDPWKGRIQPGREGYRQLEVVYSTGDAAENERALSRAEAFWIDRLKPKYNEVRPAQPFGARPARVKTVRPVRPPVRRRRRRVPARVYTLLLLSIALTYVAVRFLFALQLPWPAVPWVAGPVVGTAAAWSLFWRLHRSLRKLLR